MTAEFTSSVDESILQQYVHLLETDPIAAEQLASTRPDLADLFLCLETLDLLSAQLADDRTIVQDIFKRPSDCQNPESTQSEDVDESERHRMNLPRAFGKFQLMEEVGRGGMGVVFKAEQGDLKRTVAVKMILGNHLAHPQNIKRFYREARAAGRLRHPHIVGVHEVGDIAGQHYFSMDFVNGENLAQRLRRAPLSNEEAIRILLPIAEGVEFLHCEGVLHRDLKPSNILFDEQGLPYISDFGLARILESDDSQTESGCLIGSINYMPPEQARGEAGSTTARSDIYALGAILFEMLTGRPPFQAATRIDTLLKVLRGNPPSPRSLNPQISPELQAICLRCLAFDQADRYSSAAAIVTDLRTLLKGEPLEFPQESWGSRLWRWARREPGLSVRLGGIGVAFLTLQGRWIYDGLNLGHHLRNLAILLVWGILAWLNQLYVRRKRQNDLSLSAMSVVDSLLLTALLTTADGPLGGLWSIYPLLIVTSGLFLRSIPVAVTTIATILSSLLLFLIHPDESTYSHYLLIHIVLLVLVGIIVDQQVKRIRILDWYCEQIRP